MSQGLLKRLVELEKARLGVEPGSLSDIIYRWNLGDFVKYAVRDCPVKPCISVSDLVYCSQKYHLRRLYPEVVLADNLYAAWASFGRLIHSGVQALLRELGFRVEHEVSKVLRVNGVFVGVTGRLDALGNWKDKLTVVEIKSSRSDNELPKPQHILQLRIYMNLAKAQQGILLYITPDRIAEYTINEPISDAELEILVKETLENRKHPRYPWECSYCPFSMMCPFKVSNNNHRFYKR